MFALPSIVLAAEPEPPSTGAATTPAVSERGGLDEIVVTARRREESAQRTPVSLTVLTDDMIREQGVAEIKNLTAVVPGVNFSQSGISGNTIFSLRGMSRGVIGNAQPAVATYVNEVPLMTWANSVPTYDIASVEVLKGPQGTLFGRNTTAGAVLLTTKQPTHEFDAYAETTFGSYSWHQLDAAVNVPLMNDVIALRIAGQYAERDGYTDNMSDPENDFDDIGRRGVRASLLIEPVEGLKNVTIFDWTYYKENGSGIVFDDYYTGGTLDFIPWLPGVGPALEARRDEAGARKAWSSVPAESTRRLRSTINTTTYDFGGARLKNIFGYRRLEEYTFAEVDGSDAPLVNGAQLVDLTQYSNELNLSGSAADGSLDWIIGGFWLKQKPGGSNRLLIQALAAPGTPWDAPSPFPPFNGASGNADFYTDESYAGYGQVSYGLGALSEALDKFKVDLGLRYTKDKERACSIPGQLANVPRPDPGDCDTSGTTARTKSNKLTYTFGANYEATDEVLLYGVTRSGYRAGGVNPPLLGGTLEPFQTYDPEKATDYELGMKTNWSLGDWDGRFNVAVYHSKYKDLIAGLSTAAADPFAGPDGDFNPANNPSGFTFYTNVGEATVRGVEVEFVASLGNAFDFSVAGAYLDKKVDEVRLNAPATLGPTFTFTKNDAEETAFLASPDYSVSATVRYRLPLDSQYGDIRVGANAFWISSVDYLAIEAPSYEKVDLRVDWKQLMQSNFDASFFVTNVFDKTAIGGWGLNNPGFGATSVVYIEPRIYGFQLAYRYGER